MSTQTLEAIEFARSQRALNIRCGVGDPPTLQENELLALSSLFACMRRRLRQHATQRAEARAVAELEDAIADARRHGVSDEAVDAALDAARRSR